MQQRLGKVLASRRSLHWPDMATGMGVSSSSFCVVIVVVVVLVYQLARTFLLTFVIFTRELHKSCAIYVPGAPEHAAIEATATASDSCRLLQAWRVGVGCWYVLLGPLVTVLKLSNMPPWTVPQQLTDKCRWPGSKYCWKHFLISRHPARSALHPNTTRTMPCSLWHGKLLGQKETLERRKHSGAIFMQVIEIYKPK